jgi:septation ring formation regulator EzrA
MDESNAMSLFASLLLDSPETNSKDPIDIQDQLDGFAEKQEKIKNIVKEVNTMIGNLKDKFDVPSEESIPKFTAQPLTEESKTKLSSIFNPTKESTFQFSSLVNHIENIKEKAIFGIVVDMLYDTVIPPESS